MRSLQVYWNSLSRTYWIHWHMVEILGSSGGGGQADKEITENVPTLAETVKLSAGEFRAAPWTRMRARSWI